MNLLRPQILASSLRQDITNFMEGIAHTDSYDKAVFGRLMRECEVVQKTDVVSAFLCRAFLNSSVGQFKEVERMLFNAQRNGGVDAARIERLAHCANHGFASEALSLLDDVFKYRDGKPLMELVRGAVALGAFNKAVAAVQESLKRNEVLNMTRLHEFACRAAGVMGQLGVSDAQLAAMLDVAGESLRSHNLLWQAEQPDITVLEVEQGGPALAFEYRVDVSPQDAAQMTWDLTEALVSRDLDLPSVAVGFLGTRLQACASA